MASAFHVHTNAQTKRSDPSWIAHVLNARLVLPVPDKGVSVRKNVIYKKVATENYKLDIYEPEIKSQSPLPLVLFVHGAIPENLEHNPKEWKGFQDLGRLAALNGFVGITFEYRASENNEAAAMEDLQDVIKFVTRNQLAHSGDTERIHLMMFSWGGRLLSRMVSYNNPAIKSYLVFYGLVEPLQSNVDPKNCPPIMLVRAGLDRPDVLTRTAEFVRNAINANLPLQLINYPLGHHGFEIIDNNDTSRGIIDQAFLFLKKQR